MVTEEVLPEATPVSRLEGAGYLAFDGSMSASFWFATTSAAAAFLAEFPNRYPDCAVSVRVERAA